MVNCYQVNGRSLVGVTHHEAVDVLKEAGNNVTMVVGRLTKKSGVRSLPQGQPVRTTSTSSTNRLQPPASPNDASPPQLIAGVNASSRQVAAPSPTVPSGNQSLAPEPPRTPARLSGTASPSYEVSQFYAVSVIGIVSRMCLWDFLKRDVIPYIYVANDASWTSAGTTSCPAMKFCIVPACLTSHTLSVNEDWASLVMSPDVEAMYRQTRSSKSAPRRGTVSGLRRSGDEPAADHLTLGSPDLRDLP